MEVQKADGTKELSRPPPERKNMDLVKWAVTVAGFVLWTSGSSAAPMECHFDSRAQCVFEGRHYSLGEAWMDNACMQCTCLHPVGVGCCETVHRPVDFPAWCEVRVEPVTCKVSLVQTADPRLPCVPGETNRDPSHGSLQLQQQLEA
ncbi:prostate-associated microseminoprotein [Sphaeramia orbicularis]|uniref:prostate-associated microseminoprotein n=1 Tax=Sphaeramia orbicularis TaxID=375764 RepID=UPI00117D4F17|nr:prostate-associated microseminoprotein [Sphaeramia orbicularis]